MSSLGDVIHTLPAVVDAWRALPDIHFHWVVEEGFQDIPRMHPFVDEVIPIAVRRWRGNWRTSLSGGEVGEFIRRLRRERFDLIIDAQGLVKSAIVGLLSTGSVSGFNWRSAREPLAAVTYSKSTSVDKNLHAVERQRRLFAGILGYEVSGVADYGLDSIKKPGGDSRNIMLLHGTTWASKLWPVESWRLLCRLILENGYTVVIPAGNRQEAQRAQLIAGETSAHVLSVMDLKELASTMSDCSGAVSVDTGLGHLAVALNLPLVALYGATSPYLTGVHGERQEVIVSDHLPCIPCRKRICRYAAEDYSSKIYPPCFERTTPESVWQALQLQISKINPQPV